MSSLLDDSSTAPAVRDPFRDRRPPYAEDAEQAVISAMMMDRNAIVRAIEFVDDTMFYREAHRRLFKAILSLNERGSVVDVLTLSDELSLRGELEASGGKDYLGQLVDAVDSSRPRPRSSPRPTRASRPRTTCSTSRNSASSRSTSRASPRGSIASRNCSGRRWRRSRS
jgi:hypothetical protein